ADAMGYRSPTQIAELAKAIGPTRPDTTSINLRLGPRTASASYIAELAKATNLDQPAKVAQLAKSIGPVMPTGIGNVRRPGAAQLAQAIAATPALQSLLTAVTEAAPDAAFVEAVLAEHESDPLPTATGGAVDPAWISWVVFVLVFSLVLQYYISEANRTGEYLLDGNRARLLFDLSAMISSACVAKKITDRKVRKMLD
ncbi:hypothetical protein, partial [Kribbella sp. NPDC051620]|uniref:hypothetical protein n=1 Tax=Kribbella sp. NPDC051620 TaxID=3364120 RepID=UPI0037B99BF7